MVEEVGGAGDEGPLEAGGGVVPAGGRHVAGLCLEDELGVREVGAAVPATDGARVSGRGQRARPGVGAEEHGVLVEPGDAGLGLRDREAAVDERPVLDVELADHDGVRAVPGQHDQGAPAVRVAHRGPGPHPLLPLRRREGVDVEEDLPGGVVLAVLLGRGAPPQALRPVRVPPEVVEVRAAAHGVGDAVGVVEDLAQLAAQRLEAGVAGERGGGLGVPLADPVQCGLTRHVFQPEETIFSSHPPIVQVRWPRGDGVCRSDPPDHGCGRPRRRDGDGVATRIPDRRPRPGRVPGASRAVRPNAARAGPTQPRRRLRRGSVGRSARKGAGFAVPRTRHGPAAGPPANGRAGYDAPGTPCCRAASHAVRSNAARAGPTQPRRRLRRGGVGAEPPQGRGGDRRIRPGRATCGPVGGGAPRVAPAAARAAGPGAGRRGWSTDARRQGSGRQGGVVGGDGRR